jgi:hypothetical protein
MATAHERFVILRRAGRPEHEQSQPSTRAVTPAGLFGLVLPRDAKAGLSPTSSTGTWAMPAVSCISLSSASLGSGLTPGSVEALERNRWTVVGRRALHSFIAERPGHALELLAKVIAPARVARRSATELPGSLARPGRPQGCPRWGNWRILGLMIQFS